MSTTSARRRRWSLLARAWKPRRFVDGATAEELVDQPLRSRLVDRLDVDRVHVVELQHRDELGVGPAVEYRADVTDLRQRRRQVVPPDHCQRQRQRVGLGRRKGRSYLVGVETPLNATECEAGTLIEPAVEHWDDAEPDELIRQCLPVVARLQAEELPHAVEWVGRVHLHGVPQLVPEPFRHRTRQDDLVVAFGSPTSDCRRRDRPRAGRQSDVGELALDAAVDGEPVGKTVPVLSRMTDGCSRSTASNGSMSSWTIARSQFHPPRRGVTRR